MGHPAPALNLGAPLPKENKMASPPSERGQLATACVGKPCGSFYTGGLTPALGEAPFPGWQAHLPEARAAPVAVCPARGRKHDCAHVCVSTTVCGVLSPPPAEAVSIFPPHPHPRPLRRSISGPRVPLRSCGARSLGSASCVEWGPALPWTLTERPLVSSSRVCSHPLGQRSVLSGLQLGFPWWRGFVTGGLASGSVWWFCSSVWLWRKLFHF